MSDVSTCTSGGAETNRAIVVPREIVNADSVYLVAWRVPDGTFVQAGTPVCEIETSKAVLTLEAECGGYLCHRAAVGEEVPVGSVLGVLSSQLEPALDVGLHPLVQERGELQAISAKAREKITELGLDPSLFSARSFVRERDVMEVAARLQAARVVEKDSRGPSQLDPLNPIQRRLARVLEQAVAEIPTSYLERSVNLGAVRECARQIMRESRVLVTVVDLLVAAVSRAASRFPYFNSQVTADHQLRIFEHVNVGVAVDVDADLYVVVVKNASKKSPAAISKELRMLEYVAQRRRLSPEQVSGGTITVTSMLGLSVQRFRPLLYPQQAAIVGIADPEPGSTRAALTLGFDHRVANGSRAAAFLAVIDEELHRPGTPST